MRNRSRKCMGALLGKTTDAICAEVRPAICLYAARLTISLIRCATHGQCALIRAAFGRIGARIAVRPSWHTLNVQTLEAHSS